MRFVKNIYTASVLIAMLFCLSSCKDDENTLSEAVLASTKSLNFEPTGMSEKIITVYADADWVTEVPDWVTVTPTSGTGTMEVTISVTENVRGGALDNPRKAPLVFKGRTLASRSQVLILQGGDKYRDVKEYTVDGVIKLANEAVLSMPEATVMAVTTKGFVITDPQKTGNIYVVSELKANVGDKVSLMGSRATDKQSLPIIECDVLETISNAPVSYPEAKDITNELEKYTAKTHEFISISGVLTGKNIAVDGSTYSANIVDAPESMGVAALNGHKVTVKGYFGGVAAPVVDILAAEIKDNGLYKEIYFSENFEWLDAWSVAGGAGQTVEANNPDAAAPQVVTPKVMNAKGENLSALDTLLRRGYEFLRVTTKTPGECIYLQQNYLKFGKTSYQAGFVFPKIETVPANVPLTLAFDWSGMRQGSGKIDPVNLIIIIENDGNSTQFDVPVLGWENDHKLEWVRAEIELTGVKITKDTKITMRQIDAQWPAATANRWFLDNIELYKSLKK